MTEVPLSANNRLIADGFQNFIKYNPCLVHLDLQSASLPKKILYDIGHFLTRATSLSALHLCGNEGIDDEFIEWLRTRIRAKPVLASFDIDPLPKKFTQ